MQRIDIAALRRALYGTGVSAETYIVIDTAIETFAAENCGRMPSLRDISSKTQKSISHVSLCVRELEKHNRLGLRPLGQRKSVIAWHGSSDRRAMRAAALLASLGMLSVTADCAEQALERAGLG